MDLAGAIARNFAKLPSGSARAVEDAAGITLFLSGPLDLESSRRVQDLLAWIIAERAGQPRLVVDLAAVSYISSTGVGALSSALIAARARDLPLYLRNLQPKIRSVFTLLGLMDFFEEAPDA